MSTNEADLEYGPNPPGSKYEHTDIDPAIGYKFAIWLAVAMLMSVGIVYGTFVFFNSREDAAATASQQYPLAAGLEKPIPEPRLQTQPFKDVYLLKKGENEVLESYAWVDQPAGVVRIPIDRAMELALERGLASRPEGSMATPTVADSSAGRTMAPR